MSEGESTLYNVKSFEEKVPYLSRIVTGKALGSEEKEEFLMKKPFQSGQINMGRVRGDIIEIFGEFFDLSVKEEGDKSMYLGASDSDASSSQPPIFINTPPRDVNG